MARIDRTRRKRRDDYEDDYEEEEILEDRFAHLSRSRSPLIPFLAVGAVVVGIGLMVILSASKRAQEAQASKNIPHLTGLDIPDPPDYQHLTEVGTEGISASSNAVLAVYMFKHSTVYPVKRASKGHWNHDVTFVIADHDSTRLMLGDLMNAGVLSSKVESTDCPVTIFLKGGKEVYREKNMTYGGVQSKIDDLYHGGKASLPAEPE